MIKSLLVLVAIPIVVFLIILIRALNLLESKEEILNYKNAAASVVLADDGKLIGKIFTENRTNITYDQVPDHLVHALIATEDARFYKHRGIDTKSLFRVFIKTILLNKDNAGGGSTITQQLAKNMFGRIHSKPFPLLVNKTKEVILARRIERLFSKEEILTLYLNTVPFGENVYGIDAASFRYFNKRIGQLKPEESAVLVGILKANYMYNPRLYPENAKSRRNLVIRQMEKYEYISKKQLDSLIALPLKVNYLNLESAGPADYFVFQVRKEAEEILKQIQYSGGTTWNLEEDGLVIKSTLNLDLQNYANKAFHDHLSVMQKRLDEQYRRGWGKQYIEQLVKKELQAGNLTDRYDEIGIRRIFNWTGTVADSVSVIDSVRHNIKLLQAGLLALEPGNGYIKAWVGGIDFKTQPFDQILARRQMGSTLKPILYAAAFEDGMSPCEYLNNDSMTVAGYEDWHPANFDKTYGGKYSLTGALVHSMNIPTLHLFFKVGFNSLNSLWNNMGFSFSMVNTPSLAMGTSEASIYELAVAYAAFANGGLKITPQKILSIETPDGTVIWKNRTKPSGSRIMSDATSKKINYILQKAVNEGTGSPMRYIYGVNLPFAGKTGTSQDYTDAWFGAYNPSLVIVSRVGASLPSIHFNNSAYGTGSALALPLVAATMKQIQDNNELMQKFNSSFIFPVTEFQNEFDCPDFKEDDVLDEIWDFFKKDRVDGDAVKQKPERKRRSIFRRIFRR